MAIFDEKVSEYKKPLIKPHQETASSISKFVEEKLGKVSPAEKKSIYDLIEKKLKNKISPKNIIVVLQQSEAIAKRKNLPFLEVLQKVIRQVEQNLAQKNDIKNWQKLISVQTRNNLNKGATRSKIQAQESKIQAQESKIKFQNSSKEIKKSLKVFEQTKEAYQKLNPSLKEHRPEEVQQKLKALSPVVRAKLKKNNIALGEYASFLLSREKIAKVGKSPETEEFLKSLKNMERSLGIEEQTQWGYPLSYEPKAKVFDQNPDLAEFAKNDQTFSPLENVEIFPKGDEWDQKLIEKFGDRGLKELAGKVASLDAKQKQGEALSIQEKEMIKIYNWLAGIQKLITISKLNFSNEVTNLY